MTKNHMDDFDLGDSTMILDLLDNYLTANMVLLDTLCNKVMNLDTMYNEAGKILEQAQEDAKNLRKALKLKTST